MFADDTLVQHPRNHKNHRHNCNLCNNCSYGIFRNQGSRLQERTVSDTLSNSGIAQPVQRIATGWTVQESNRRDFSHPFSGHGGSPLSHSCTVGKGIIYNKPTRCNSGSIVFIKNYTYALHVSDDILRPSSGAL